MIELLSPLNFDSKRFLDHRDIKGCICRDAFKGFDDGVCPTERAY